MANVQVEVWGGGGGSGGSQGTKTAGGGGGGGYALLSIAVTSGTVYTVTVGAGGTAGTGGGSGTNGGLGGTSWFDTSGTVSATGGGGSLATTNGFTAGTGGAGTNGSTKTSGGNGDPGAGSGAFAVGGGGGAAAQGGSGATATSYIGGLAGDTGTGTAGAGNGATGPDVTTTAGVAGNPYGGGAAGATAGSTGSAGAAGGNGAVVISAPTGTITSATGGTPTTSGGRDYWKFTTTGASTWTPTISQPSGINIDGSVGSTPSGGTSSSVSLTTSWTNDIIVVYVGSDSTTANSSVVSNVTATGLTFAKRSSKTLASDGNTFFNDLEVWWAYSSGTLSALSIAVTWANTIDDAVIVAFGVNAGTSNPAFSSSSPWDINGVLPVTATGISTASNATVNISTHARASMLLGFVGNDGYAGPGSFHGWIATGSATTVPNSDLSNGGGSKSWGSGIAYQVVSSAQSSTAMTLEYDNSTTGGWWWSMIGDAIAVPGTSSNFLSLLGAGN